jgi:hypothetical protein
MFRWSPACTDVHVLVVAIALDLAGHEGFDLEIVDETGEDGRVIQFP